MGQISKKLVENFGYKLNEADDWVSAHRDEEDVIDEIKVLINSLKNSKDPSAAELSRAAQKRLAKFLKERPPADSPAASPAPAPATTPAPSTQQPGKAAPSSGLTPDEEKRLEKLQRDQAEYEKRKAKK